MDSSVTIKAVGGPDQFAFVYLEGSIPGAPQVTQRRSIATAALASGALTIAGEKAALEADVQQALTNWTAAQAALQEL